MMNRALSVRAVRTALALLSFAVSVAFGAGSAAAARPGPVDQPGAEPHVAARAYSWGC